MQVSAVVVSRSVYLQIGASEKQKMMESFVIESFW